MNTAVQRFRALLVGAAVAGLFALGGCEGAPESYGNAPGGGAAGPAGGEQVGTVSMELRLASGFRFDSVHYEITGNGFHKEADVDVSSSSTFSTIIGGIPFGQGYMVRLSTQDVDHRLAPCAGSASFDITSAAILPVPVNLSCHEVPRVAPAPVPVPRGAIYAIAVLLLALGAAACQRRAS